MQQQRNPFTTKCDCKGWSRAMFRLIVKALIVSAIAVIILAASELPSVAAKKLIDLQEKQLQELVK